MPHIKQSDLPEFIKPYLSAHPTIVEVGAFKGHDTIRLATAFPESRIYAFEPVPELYEALVAATHIYPNITPIQAAVSDRDGMMPLYVSQKPSGKTTQASSLQKPKERLTHSPITFPETIMVPTVNLASWAATHNIKMIDLLWLDTQGHEMTILHSIKNLLPHVRMIYTEVGFTEAYEGQAHADQVIAWLKAEGFTPVAQDFENPPTWFFGNILFTRNYHPTYR
jgi:FkbM family methyltransferase